MTGNYFDYPTASDDGPSNELVNPDPGNNANFEDEGGYSIGRPYYTTEVGEFENSASPCDTFDQGGNLWEWNETADWFNFGRAGFWTRVLRGGSWTSGSGNLHASDRGMDYDPTSQNAFIGFRVASIPEPGTTVLAIIALLGLLCWRRAGS